MCRVVREENYQAWKVKDAEYQKQQAAKALQQKLRSGSSVLGSAAPSDGGSTCADTISFEEWCEKYDARQTARCEDFLRSVPKEAKLALSKDEEREARKIEKKT